MQITRQADYAVRAVLYLSKMSNGGRAPTSKIAHDQHIPPSFLAKIVSQLSVAGVVQTSRSHHPKRMRHRSQLLCILWQL